MGLGGSSSTTSIAATIAALSLAIAACNGDSTASSGGTGDSSGTTEGTSTAGTTTASGTGTSTGATTSGGTGTGASMSGTETGTTTTASTGDTATTGTSSGGTTMGVTQGSGTTAVDTTTGVDSTTGGDTTTGGMTTGGVTTGDMTTGMQQETGLWLISIEDTSSPTRLFKVDLMTGNSTHLCDLDTSNDYNTSTFSRDGLLYTANANTQNLEIIDPCTCKRTVVGPTKVTALPGITADQAEGLYGLETNLDVLVTLDTMSGAATPIGPLGINWGTGGLTWSDGIKNTYAINGTDDTLYVVDHMTGKASVLVKTNYNFGSVGIEWHPKTEEIYACSNSAELFQVDPKTGVVTTIGPMNYGNPAAHCDNLAAPWTLVQCVEDK